MMDEGRLKSGKRGSGKIVMRHHVTPWFCVKDMYAKHSDVATNLEKRLLFGQTGF